MNDDTIPFMQSLLEENLMPSLDNISAIRRYLTYFRVFLLLIIIFLFQSQLFAESKLWCILNLEMKKLYCLVHFVCLVVNTGLCQEKASGKL